MTAGATKAEGEDAAAKALADILMNWGTREFTLAYARKATVHNFIKDKTRGNPRLIARLIERGYVPVQEGAMDRQLTDLEDRNWVADVLSILPPIQHLVLGSHLRKLREQRRITAAQTADAICSSHAKIIWMEHGRAVFKEAVAR